MIHVHQLSKAYIDLQRGEFLALDQLSFEAKPGQVYGLLGPNGAGKTTALRILSTMLRPTSGTATINGCNVATEATRVRQQIGFVSANTAIYDRMTAWEMVSYFGKLYGLEDDRLQQQMQELFERLQMNSFRDVLGAKMSSGMKQKVSIARALVHDPPVLIFDEATVGLDVLVARSLLETVAELRDKGKCIVYSTHIMREAERLCDQIAIMYEGNILAEGTVESLLATHNEKDLEDLFFGLITKHQQANQADPQIQTSTD